MNYQKYRDIKCHDHIKGMMTKMHTSVIMELDKNDDYYKFLREKPYWHRQLSRHPDQIDAFIEDYKIVRRKRLVDKIEDISMIMTLARELM